jgi:hypothetical protein
MFEQKRLVGRHLLSLPNNLETYCFCSDKVKKTHKPRYCEKEKDKASKRILRSLSFDNNGLVKPSCGTVALYHWQDQDI